MTTKSKTLSTDWHCRFLGVALWLAVVLAPGLALAADLTVDGGATLQIPPSITYENETVGDLGLGTINQVSDSNTATGNLILGNSATGSGTYNLSGSGSLSAASERVGYSGSGTFIQSGGTHIVGGDLSLGFNSTGSGAYNLSGTGSLAADVESIGTSGRGTFTQDGGINQVFDTLYIGENAGASGTYNLNGGILAAGYTSIGTEGSGTFNQTGGTNLSYELYLGDYAGGSGTYNLTGGSLFAGVTVIGYEGSGTFNQSSGEHSVDNSVGTGVLSLGLAPDASGTYNLNSGSLASFMESIGTEGSGTFNQTGGTHLTGVIYLGDFADGSGTYNLSNGSLHAMAEAVGFEGDGTFNQSGGTHTVTDGFGSGELTLGVFAGGSGTYNLSGGSLTADYTEVGFEGSGTFNQTGGTNKVNYELSLGYETGGSGTYNLSAGQLEVAGGEYVGDYGSGTFNQTGGTHTVDDGSGTAELVLGWLAGASGSYNLSGGSLMVSGNEYVGLSGSGDFTQRGGTHTVTGSLTLGANAGSSGAYNLSNGILEVGGDEVIGWDGSGTFTQGGGTHTIGGTLILGINTGSSGSYNLNGGSLEVADEIIGNNDNGSFIQNGGTHTISGGLTLANESGSSGSYNLTGGSLVVANEAIGAGGSGSFTQSGGSHNISGDLFLGADGSGSGTYNLSDGSLAVAGDEYLGFYGCGTFTQSGGSHTVTGTLTLAANAGSSGTYNLQGGSLNAGTVMVNSGGLFNQSGGSAAVTDLFLGINAGGSSTYNLSGGSLTAGNEYIGISGDGAFGQTGGTHTVVNNLYLGAQTGGLGSYFLEGGSLEVGGNEIIGATAEGNFTQTDGSHTVTNNLILADQAGASGSYALTGGSLAVGGSAVIGNAGAGTFLQSGGTNTVANTLILGAASGSDGAYLLTGGSLAAANVCVGQDGSGALMQTGGSHTVANHLFLGDQANGMGSYALNDGLLAVGGNEVIGNLGQGAFIQGGGSHTVAGALTLAAGTGSSGTYELDGGSLSAGLININTGGHFLRNGGTLNYDILNFQGGDYTGDLVNLTLVTGTGTINGNLVNAGTVSPGNSPGTLTINGSYTQTATGTNQVEIASASVYDQIKVTGTPGTANLNGTLAISLLGGYRPLGNQVFSIITATGGITGTFSSIINQQIGLTLSWQTRYLPNSVDLVAQRDYTGSALGLTRNQWAVGNMLNGVADTATGDLNTVLNAIDSLGTAGEVRSAYTQISPEKAGALVSLGLSGARFQMRNLAEFITNGRFGTRAVQSAFGLDSLGSSGISGAGLMLAYNGSSLAQLLTGSKAGTTASPWSFYLLPNLLLGSQTSTLNQTGYAFTGAGFTLGGDFRVQDDLLVGAATGYNHMGASFHGSGGSLENNNWPITVYAAYLPQTFYAFGSLGYSLDLYTLNRNLSFDSISRRAKSSPIGHQFNGYGEAGYDLKWRRLVVTPFASLAYSQIWVGGFKEDGANSLNLQVDSQSAASLQTGVGAKISVPIKRNSTLVVPQFYASYQHEFADDSRGLNARLSQGGSTFTWLTEEPRRDYAVLGTNVTLGIRKNVRAQLDYNVEVGRGTYTAHSLTAGLRWEF